MEKKEGENRNHLDQVQLAGMAARGQHGTLRYQTAKLHLCWRVTIQKVAGNNHHHKKKQKNTHKKKQKKKERKKVGPTFSAEKNGLCSSLWCRSSKNGDGSTQRHSRHTCLWKRW
jgi:hypothetical protein